MTKRHASTFTLGLGILGLAVLFSACGDHDSTQEANAACDVILADRVNTTDGTDDELFAACVACHENCGNDCTEEGTIPPEFVCPD